VNLNKQSRKTNSLPVQQNSIAFCIKQVLKNVRFPAYCFVFSLDFLYYAFSYLFCFYQIRSSNYELERLYFVTMTFTALTLENLNPAIIM